MTDGTDALCLALYGLPAEPRDYLGGSEARMLHDAAAKLVELRTALEAVSTFGPAAPSGRCWCTLDMPDMPHDRACVAARGAVGYAERSLGNLGEPGIRDPENLCADYDPGARNAAARCETDGHYLCAKCKHNYHRPLKEMAP